MTFDIVGRKKSDPDGLASDEPAYLDLHILIKEPCKSYVHSDLIRSNTVFRMKTIIEPPHVISNNVVF